MPSRIGPVNPELVGLLEDLRVAVGAADGHDDGPARLNHAAADLDILGGDPGGQLDRAVVAEHLFNRRRYQGRILAEPVPVVRVAEQGDRAVPDQVHGGLEPSDQQQQSRLTTSPELSRVPLLLGPGRAAALQQHTRAPGARS